MNQLRVRPLIQGKCIHVSRRKVESGPTAARLMKRGRTSATIGHDESAVSGQQHPLWREAAAPVVAKAIYGKITFLPEGGLKHFERNKKKRNIRYRQVNAFITSWLINKSGLQVISISKLNFLKL